MNYDKKNCRVTIFGTPYVLSSDESDESVRKSAALVDVLMHEVAQAHGSGRDVRQVMVLTALRLAERVILLEKMVEDAKRLEQVILDRIEQARF